MHIINDFFLLVWNEKPAKNVVFDESDMLKLNQNLSKTFDNFCDGVAILLIINSQNFANMALLEEPKSLLKTWFEEAVFSDKNLQTAQFKLLSYCIALGNLRVNEAIAKRLDILQKEGIISYDTMRFLQGLLAFIEEKKVVLPTLHVKRATTHENYYKTAINGLHTAIENLLLLVENSRLKERLHVISERLEDQRFSIGITGVMNAGKSTMLNALLGQEVLGTAVVPETANLTVIKYAKEPYAVVNFWNEKEWANIEESSKSLKSLEAFVKESQAHFGEKLHTFVTKEGQSERIGVHDLALYTSAKHSDKKCNLVKSVELYIDLKFVQDGVQIVDTPGLDDPVIQREEITLEYLSECDLMIHLMNAAQAATQKDVDFIIDALLYRNVAQLLVVITRIDAITQKELQEVIAYTKRSIEARLKEQNKGAKLDEVIAKIVFIPIAGKLALMHKLGRAEEALKLGYDMEQTGLPLVESYLEEVLFGSNSQKAHLIIASNQKEIESIMDETLKAFEEEQHFLTLSQEEIERAYLKHQEDKKAMMHFLEQIKSSVAQSQEEMRHYFITLQTFATHRLSTLQNLLKRRISDDVSYEVSKHKKLPKEERIGAIIETAMKDGMIDLMRDYRYEFQKKMQNIVEYLDTKYGEFKEEEGVFLDAQAFCEAHLSSLSLFKNSAVLIADVNDAIRAYGKSDGSAFNVALDERLGKEFAHLKERVMEKIQSINQELLSSFLKVSQAPAVRIEEHFLSKEALIETAMAQMQDVTHTKEARVVEIQEKERVMGVVLEDLRRFKEEK